MPIQLFRLPLVSPAELLALAVLLLALILLLSAWHMAAVIKDRRVRSRLLRHRAEDRAHERHLTEEETEVLVRMTLDLGTLPGVRSFSAHAETMAAHGVSRALLESLGLKLGLNQPVPSQRLVSTRDCVPGQDVSLTDARHAWKAGILAVDNDALILKVPAEAASRLAPRDIVKVSFWRELDARYFFLSRVLSVATAPVPLVRLEHPARLDRYQDREFYRADVHWRVHLTRIEREAWESALAGEAGSPGDQLEGTLVDISPGGFRLAPLGGISPEDHLLVGLPFPEAHPLTIHARVIAVDPDWIRCEFLNLTLHEQDLIHHEILHQRRTKKT